MIALALLVVLMAVIAAVAFQRWTSHRGAVARPGTEATPPGRVSLLTEAVAYIGAILVIAGGAAGVGQRWDEISAWGRVGILAGAAALFLLAGALVRHVAEPAISRLAAVLWFVSVAAAAGAVGVAGRQLADLSGERVVLAVGVATAAYGGVLWLARRRALQQVAVLVGLVLTTFGATGTIAGGEPPLLPTALALWAVGLAWAALGWWRRLEPMWAAVPLGVLLALWSPSMVVGPHGWYYAIAIGTAAAVMAVSVPAQNPVLLGMGALAMFGYVTGAVVRFFGDALGVPAALSLTGLLILGLALVTARLLKAVRPSEELVAEDAADRELHPVG